MSKTRLVSSLAGAVAVVAAACWMASATFPLSAAPEALADSPGVQVDMGPAALLHRTAVIYPEAAREQGVQGTVVLQAAVDGKGNVTDAQVLSGPDELRKAALSSVLNWHFAPDSGARTHQVSITFQPGYAQAPPKPAPATAALSAPAKLQDVRFAGLSDSAQAELHSRLRSQFPIQLGDTVDNRMLADITKAVKEFDSHLTVFTSKTPDGQAILTIAPADAVPSQSARIRVGGNVQSAKLISKPVPVYPPLAKQAGIQGVVKLVAFIGKDGAVQNLNVISGHPLLVPAALEAVKQWVYQTTLLNGEPVDVETEIDVNFTLAQ